VKTKISRVLETTIELGNLKVLYQTTSSLKGFFLTFIGMGAARHFQFGAIFYHFLPFLTVEDYKLFWTISNHYRPFWTISGLCRPFGPFF
jgi:hypothetical protein